MGSTRQKITIQHVAKDCNLSVATISRVLNGATAVRPETRQKVLRSAYRLGYIHSDPDVATYKKLILVLLPSIENTFYAPIIKGIQSASQRYGFIYVIYEQDGRDFSYEMLASLITQIHAAGIVFLCTVSNAKLLDEISELVPVIQCCEFNAQSKASYVSVDDYCATRRLMNYIISKGYKKIAILNSGLRHKYAQERQRAYLDTLNEAGLLIQQSWIRLLDEVSFTPAVSVATQMLSSDDRPDAIFAVADIFAAATIKAAKQLGLSVPGDLGVAGFDNTTISVLTDPTITTVNQPMYQMGYLACEILINHIESVSIQPQQLLLNTEIVVRDSL